SRATPLPPEPPILRGFPMDTLHAANSTTVRADEIDEGETSGGRDDAAPQSPRAPASRQAEAASLGRNWRPSVLRTGMRVLSRASPGHAVGLMDRIWFTPPRLRRRPGPEAERWLARAEPLPVRVHGQRVQDRKSTRLNSSHVKISYAVFCLKKKKTEDK